MSHGGARIRERRDAESGVSAIEFVAFTPLLFLLILGTVQFALYMYSRHVAIAAAQEGARVAREEAATTPGWQTDAQDKAKGWVKQLAPGLTTVDVPLPTSETVDGIQDVTVTVTVNVLNIVPGTSGFSVTESSTGPVEQFVPDR
jgi:Flp pilus assembly protein TadG